MLLTHKIKCEFSVGEAIGQIIIWIILTIITLGLALFVLPYYFVKAPINRSFLLNQQGKKIGSLSSNIAFSDIIGHALLWFLLTIVTFGFAYLVYWPAVIKRVLNAVEVTEL